MTKKGSASLALVFTASIAVAGCRGRNPKEIQAMPHPAPQAWVPIERAPALVQQVVPAAGTEMGLGVKEPGGAGVAWVLSIGARLETGGMFYRVEVEPIPGNPNASAVSVIGISADSAMEETHETFSKPSELAFRIATLALAQKGSR